jgi:hypothetical protein
MLGPYALLMPAEEIQKFRDKMQNEVNALDKTLTERDKDTAYEED